MAPPVQSCENCKFFKLINTETGQGQCRIRAPKAMDDEGESPTKKDIHGRRWPVCWTSEWCGEWKSEA